MATELLFDYSEIDLDITLMDREAIRSYIDHRGVVEQLDRVIWVNDKRTTGLGTRLVRGDEWWVEGHIPGNPILPGVLMVETAAQFSSIIYHYKMELNQRSAPTFLSFAGIEKARFRAMVNPGDELLFLIQEKRFSSRCIVADVQALIDFRHGSYGTIVFEARVSGAPVARIYPNIKSVDDDTIVVA